LSKPVSCPDFIALLLKIPYSEKEVRADLVYAVRLATLQKFYYNQPYLRASYSLQCHTVAMQALSKGLNGFNSVLSKAEASANSFYGAFDSNSTSAFGKSLDFEITEFGKTASGNANNSELGNEVFFLRSGLQSLYSKAFSGSMDSKLLVRLISSLSSEDSITSKLLSFSDRISLTREELLDNCAESESKLSELSSEAEYLAKELDAQGISWVSETAFEKAFSGAGIVSSGEVTSFYKDLTVAKEEQRKASFELSLGKIVFSSKQKGFASRALSRFEDGLELAGHSITRVSGARERLDSLEQAWMKIAFPLRDKVLSLIESKRGSNPIAASMVEREMKDFPLDSPLAGRRVLQAMAFSDEAPKWISFLENDSPELRARAESLLSGLRELISSAEKDGVDASFEQERAKQFQEALNYQLTPEQAQGIVTGLKKLQNGLQESEVAAYSDLPALEEEALSLSDFLSPSDSLKLSQLLEIHYSLDFGNLAQRRLFLKTIIASAVSRKQGELGGAISSTLSVSTTGEVVLNQESSVDKQFEWFNPLPISGDKVEFSFSLPRGFELFEKSPGLVYYSGKITLEGVKPLSNYFIRASGKGVFASGAASEETVFASRDLALKEISLNFDSQLDSLVSFSKTLSGKPIVKECSNCEYSLESSELKVSVDARQGKNKAFVSYYLQNPFEISESDSTAGGRQGTSIVSTYSMKGSAKLEGAQLDFEKSFSCTLKSVKGISQGVSGEKFEGSVAFFSFKGDFDEGEEKSFKVVAECDSLASFAEGKLIELQAQNASEKLLEQAKLDLAQSDYSSAISRLSVAEEELNQLKLEENARADALGVVSGFSAREDKLSGLEGDLGEEFSSLLDEARALRSQSRASLSGADAKAYSDAIISLEKKAKAIALLRVSSLSSQCKDCGLNFSNSLSLAREKIEVGDFKGAFYELSKASSILGVHLAVELKEEEERQAVFDKFSQEGKSLVDSAFGDFETVFSVKEEWKARRGKVSAFAEGDRARKTLEKLSKALSEQKETLAEAKSDYSLLESNLVVLGDSVESIKAAAEGAMGSLGSGTEFEGAQKAFDEGNFLTAYFLASDASTERLLKGISADQKKQGFLEDKSLIFALLAVCAFGTTLFLALRGKGRKKKIKEL
jgi:hypothetical protein